MKKIIAVLLLFCIMFSSVFSEETESESEIMLTELIEKVEPNETYELTGEELRMLLETIDIYEKDIEALEKNKEDWINWSDKAMDLLKAYEEENKQLQIENDFLFGGITISVSIAVCGAAVWLCTALDNTENW